MAGAASGLFVAAHVGSSIAALVVSSAVNLQRVTLTAGSGASGAAGADGASIPNYAGPSPSGGAQVWTGAAGNGFVPISGGPGAVNIRSMLSRSAAQGVSGRSDAVV